MSSMNGYTEFKIQWSKERVLIRAEDVSYVLEERGTTIICMDGGTEIRVSASYNDVLTAIERALKEYPEQEF